MSFNKCRLVGSSPDINSNMFCFCIFLLSSADSSPCMYCLHRSNVEEDGAWEPSNHWRNNRLSNEWTSNLIIINNLLINLLFCNTLLFLLLLLFIIVRHQCLLRTHLKAYEPHHSTEPGVIGKLQSQAQRVPRTKEAFSIYMSKSRIGIFILFIFLTKNP